ncbi:MAG TPA: right-handed parallel beta-helix repeat-containing protein, partial [Anaerolineae bacterium]|nr:right-handed parallel beta-helix repeat-containing protein [Anaerolineae bacterium]
MSTTRALFIMLGASFFMLAVALALSAAGGQESLAADGIIYVDADATALGNGTSWEDAYTTLQPALDGAVTGDQIWVAVGIYTPTHEFSPGDPRSATFQLKNGVALYGGFDPSVGDVDWEDRDWVNNVTILSGELGDPGNADNSYHVFYHPSASALDSTAVLDGFKITGGNASGGSQHNWGGGMHNRDSSPTVANCTFAGNSATQYGGGMFNFFSCSPAVTNCTFSDNSAYRGGGMYSHVSSPAVTNCTFSGNSAGVDGGGMYNDNSSPQLTNCTFSGNSTSGSGGAIHNWYSSLAVTNSILWGDSPDEISNSSSGSMVTYSDVQGGSDGTGNIDEEPLFVDPGIGDYHLSPGSPCIDTGTNGAPNLP